MVPSKFFKFIKFLYLNLEFELIPNFITIKCMLYNHKKDKILLIQAVT